MAVIGLTAAAGSMSATHWRNAKAPCRGWSFSILRSRTDKRIAIPACALSMRASASQAVKTSPAKEAATPSWRQAPAGAESVQIGLSKANASSQRSNFSPITWFINQPNLGASSALTPDATNARNSTAVPAGSVSWSRIRSARVAINVSANNFRSLNGNPPMLQAQRLKFAILKGRMGVDHPIRSAT